MDDTEEDFPALLAALENAQAGAFVSVETMRALVRELHRLFQECRDMRRRLEEIERAARYTPPGYRSV